MKIHPTCTATEFKNDISELCENCPLTSKIKIHIEKQVIPQAKLKKEMLNVSQFESYVNNEILKATEAMAMALGTENDPNQGDEFRSNRIKLYILGKECIKALNQVSSPTTTDSKQDFPNFFKSYLHYKFALTLIDKVEPKKQLSDCSFIYRKMINDGFIDENFPQKSIMDFFAKHNYVLDRFKTYSDCKTKPRKDLYSTSKADFQRKNNCVL